jgi:uncharacterized protein (TIGR02996 family)
MTESHFESILDQNPSDWDTRLLYADWLEEQGQHIRANGQRWQAKWEKCPEYLTNTGAWGWAYYVYRDGLLYHPEVKKWTPELIWNSIPYDYNPLIKRYGTRQDAEIALAEGLRRRGIAIEMQPTPVEAG